MRENLGSVFWQYERETEKVYSGNMSERLTIAWDRALLEYFKIADRLVN